MESAEYVTFSCLFCDLLDNGAKMEYTIIIRMILPMQKTMEKGAALC